jgi:hypothetical protein
MANGRTHRKVGTASGAIAAFARTRLDDTPIDVILHVLGGYVGGAMGAALPDVIEPAVHSHHRHVAHSWTTVAGITAASAQFLVAWEDHCRAQAAIAAARRTDPALTDLQRQGHWIEELLWKFLHGVVPGLATGYLSHLVLDAATPRGIPLLVRGF